MQRLLTKIFERESDQPLIVGSGSKFTFSIFADGYFHPKSKKGQKYAIFRDRDFDIQPSAEIKLLQVNEKSLLFLTHRACIENYFLNAELIHDYWESQYREKQDNPSSKWGHKNSPGIEEIADWIDSAARILKDYQAVRCALGDILQSSAARTHLKTTWTGKSGKLPLSLTLSDCRLEALKLIQAIAQLDITQHPDLMEFKTKIRKISSRSPDRQT